MNSLSRKHFLRLALAVAAVAAAGSAPNVFAAGDVVESVRQDLPPNSPEDH